MLMKMWIITVPLHFISLLNRILLFDGAAADDVTEESCASWEHLINTTFGEATFSKVKNIRCRLDFNLSNC